MTDQISDKLSVEFPGLSLDDWRLYGVITGDPTQNYGWGEPYPFRTKPSPPKNPPCSALWRGYVASYRLTLDGHLCLTGYEYPFAKHHPPQEVSERLEGDFWLVLKTQFRAPRMYLPFVSSTVVPDPARWLHEKRSGSNVA